MVSSIRARKIQTLNVPTRWLLYLAVAVLTLIGCTSRVHNQDASLLTQAYIKVVANPSIKPESVTFDDILAEVPIARRADLKKLHGKGELAFVLHTGDSQRVGPRVVFILNSNSGRTNVILEDGSVASIDSRSDPKKP